MRVQPFGEMPCTICAKPIDFEVDLYADEHGKAVHEDCYVTRITGHNQGTAENLMRIES